MLPPPTRYAVYTLQYNTTYSAQYIPITEVWKNTDDIYLEDNGLKFLRPMKIRATVCATFNRSTGEIWLTMRDNTANIATTIHNNTGWATLNLDCVYDVTTSSWLRLFKHDSGVETNYRGIASPLYMSQFIVQPIL